MKMKLSAPVYLLKRQARVLAGREKIPLHDALDRVARREGFNGWSLLAARARETMPGKALADELKPGDLMLLGARAGQGKTLLSLALMVEAMKAGRRGVFFALEYSETDVAQCFDAIGESPETFRDLFELDNADAISAPYIMSQLATAPRGTVVVVDYLQLLDQRRENPELMDQVQALEVFARERGMTFVFLSQIHWRYDPAVSPCPGLADVRLPNPLNLKLFSKTCFLNGGELTFSAVA